ncbi:MAG: hypothetical protein FJ315_01390 [SAR202 cluster bacterium]|nr:hypothetical protein [SAR202 cluster bacterium]
MARGLPYPGRKLASVVMSFDDLHPGTSEAGYDGGGDLDRGVLGWLSQLLRLHPSLKVVLFTVPAWREKEPAPNPVLKRVPFLRDAVYLGGAWGESTWRLDRHKAFCDYVQAMPRVELAVHGLHHVVRGRRGINEFSGADQSECRRKILRAEHILTVSGLNWVRGFSPPNWNAPPPLLDALAGLGYEFLASSRDIWTDIAPGVETNGSGLRGVPLLHPCLLPGRPLVHIPSNWSATSSLERAYRIIDTGGMLAIKGHMVKRTKQYSAVDGLDEQYFSHLHALLSGLESRFGDSLWWATMGEVARWLKSGTGGSDVAASEAG